jgi:hypothetical protein
MLLTFASATGGHPAKCFSVLFPREGTEMKQRGKQSAEAKSIPTNGDDGRIRLEPPDNLSMTEARIFREVVATSPTGKFSHSDVFMLVTFSRITALLDDAMTAVRQADDGNLTQKIKVVTELAKTQTTISTKLRLAPQSRTSHQATARQHLGHNPSYYDLMRAKGWDTGDD